MEWLNLHSSVLDSPEVVGSDPVERGTWLMLSRFCIGQENGGRIVGCKDWKDRKWQQLVRVTLHEITVQSDLWQWDGDDLVVYAYPAEKEAEVKTNRENGKLGGRPPKQKNQKPSPPKTQEKPPGFASVNPPETTRHEIAETERKGRGMEGEWNGMEVCEERALTQPAPLPEKPRSESPMDALAAKVNSLRPEWQRIHCFTGAEMHALHNSAGTLDCFTPADWDLMRRYLVARIPEGKPKWQPTSRLKLLEHPADVLTLAESWQRSQRPPVRQETGNVVPIKPFVPIPRAELESIFNEKHA